MLKFPVSVHKQEELHERMHKLHLVEGMIEESYFKASGPGGQKVNKTLTGVTLLHRPTGIRVRCQRERSQGINRFIARRLLVEELEAREYGKTRHEAKAAKLREGKDRRRGSRKRADGAASADAMPPKDPPTLLVSVPKGGSGFDLATAMNAYFLRPLPLFMPPGER